MKKIIISIIAMMMSATAVVAQTPSVENFVECKAYLAEHPADTICEKQIVVCSEAGVVADNKPVALGDTLVLTTKVYLNAAGKVARHRAYTKTVREEVKVTNAAYDSLCVETQFAEKISEGRRRDILYYQGEGNLSDGKAENKAANKDGWSILAEGSYQFADGCNAFSGKVGVSYTGPWWMIDLVGGPSRTIYSNNANHAGQNYTALAIASGVYAQPFKFDRYDVNRLFIGGGYGFESYKTDSRETVFDDGSKRNMRSWGNYGYLHCGLLYERRFFATGHSLYVRAEWREKSLIIQNTNTETKSAFELTVGFKWGVGRKVVNNHLGK